MTGMVPLASRCSPASCCSPSRLPPPRTTLAGPTATRASSSPTSTSPRRRDRRGGRGHRGRGPARDVVRRRARHRRHRQRGVRRPTKPQFKLVYAYASDRPNRFAAWKDALQADVSLIGRFMGAQSGGRKTPRFDMGTDCGPSTSTSRSSRCRGPRAIRGQPGRAQEPTSRAAAPARPGPPAQRRRARRPAVERAARTLVGPRRELARRQPGAAQRLTTTAACSRRCGSPTASRARRRPGRLVARGHAARDDAQPRRRRRHAPHATLNGHCYDGYDVMCYDDGGGAADATRPARRSRA